MKVILFILAYLVCYVICYYINRYIIKTKLYYIVYIDGEPKSLEDWDWEDIKFCAAISLGLFVGVLILLITFADIEFKKDPPKWL